jgi:Flp pilus assembly pilin Flp
MSSWAPRRIVSRLLQEERGQDLIEYALVTAGIGLAGIAVWPAITAAVGTVYGTLVGLEGPTQGHWEVPNPGGGT